jgi:hypothetical protein
LDFFEAIFLLKIKFHDTKKNIRSRKGVYKLPHGLPSDFHQPLPALWPIALRSIVYPVRLQQKNEGKWSEMGSKKFTNTDAGNRERSSAEKKNIHTSDIFLKL